ncbi:MAG: DNRLRE domain-containing protein [Planctomycetota bacterium]|jgi:hypothetical protein
MKYFSLFGILLCAILAPAGELPDSERAVKCVKPAEDDNVLSRTRYSTTYMLPDGRRQIVSHAGPANYLGPGGVWRPIDRNLKKSRRAGYDFQAVENEFQVYFKKRLGKHAILVEDRNRKWAFTMELLDAGKGSFGNGEVSGNEITYDSGTGKTALQYMVGYESLSEALILNDGNSLPALRWEISLRGVKAKEENGRISLISDSKGLPVAVFRRPFLEEKNERFDSDGNIVRTRCHGVRYRFSRPDERTIMLEKVLDDEGRRWLASSERVFPVVLDPSVVFLTEDGTDTINDADDCIYSPLAPPAWSYADQYVMLNSHMSVYDPYCGFLFKGITIARGSTINSGTYLSLAAESNYTEATIMDVYAHRSSNSAPFAENDNPYNRYNTSKTTASTTWQTGTWNTNQYNNGNDIAPVVQELINLNGWDSGGNIAIITTRLELLSRNARSKEYSGGSYRPKLYVTYTPSPAAHYLEFHEGGNVYGETCDTYLSEGNNSSNYGTQSILASGWNPIHYTIICFPYIFGDCAADTVPFGSKIVNAKLNLKTGNYSSGNAFWAARVLTDWNENSATYLMATTRQPWEDPGMEENDVYYGEEHEVYPTTTATFFGFGVTEIVQAWADGQPNYGIMIDVDDDSDYIEWFSSNWFTVADRPSLQVWFDPPSGTQSVYQADTSSQSTCHATSLQYDNMTIQGGSSFMWSEEISGNHFWKSLIKWTTFIGPSAGMVYPGSTVYLARQELKVQNQSVDEQVTHRLEADWDESYAHWFQRLSGTNWNTPGLSYPNDYRESSTGDSFFPESYGAWYYQFVTDDVRGWVKEDFSNYGWLLQTRNGTQDQLIYYSDNNGTPLNRPRLHVFWAQPMGGTPPGQPTNLQLPYNTHEWHWDCMDFRSIYNDDGPVDVRAVRYRAQIAEDPAFNSIYWDSGVPFVGPLNPGQISDWLEMTGPHPEIDVTYYLRMRYYTSMADEGLWSAPKEFTLVDSMAVMNRKGYHLLTLFMDTEDQTVQELFGDNLPALYIYGYNESNRTYYKPTTLNPYEGYFIWSPTGSTVALGAVGEDVENTFITIPLSLTNTGNFDNDGWNLIRNPFYTEDWPLSWKVWFELQNCGTTFYWPWNGNEYAWFNSEDDSFGNGGNEFIGQGASFWVHAIGTDAFVRIYHPWCGPPPSPAPKPLPPPIVRWRMPITAVTGTCCDTSTYAAVRENASPLHDGMDVLDITPLTTYYVRVFFNHDDWGYYNGKYTQDARPLPDDGESITWTATVEAADADGTVELDWEIPPVAAAWDFILRDDAAGIVLEMNTAAGYSYPALGADTRTFTIIATRRGDIIPGDVNGDSIVNYADALIAAQTEHGIITLDDWQRSLADVDASGKVDVLDALIIRRLERGHLDRPQ